MIIREKEEPWPCDAPCDPPCDPPCDGWAHCDVTMFVQLPGLFHHGILCMLPQTCWTGRAQTRLTGDPRDWSVIFCGQTWPNCTSPTRKPVLVPEHSWMWCRWLDATPVRQFFGITWNGWKLFHQCATEKCNQRVELLQSTRTRSRPGELGSALDRPATEVRWKELVKWGGLCAAHDSVGAK